MVQFYVRKIKDGTITLEGVPLLWRSKVAQLLQDEMKEETK